MRRLVLRQRYFPDICSIAVVTLALFQRSVMGLKKCGKQIKRQMRCLEVRQRYFTDICSIAVVTLALFQRSVMGLKKCGKQIKRKQLAIQHTPAILFGYHGLAEYYCSKLVWDDLQPLPSPSQLIPFRLRIGPRMRTTAKQEGWKTQQKF
jgi:hypothetical protein